MLLAGSLRQNKLTVTHSLSKTGLFQSPCRALEATWLTSECEVEAGVGDEVAHGADVLRRHVGQEWDLTRGLVGVDLGELHAAEDTSGPIGAWVVVSLSL